MAAPSAPSPAERKAREIVEGLRGAVADADAFVRTLGDDAPEEHCSRYLWNWRSPHPERIGGTPERVDGHMTITGGRLVHPLKKSAAPIVTDAAFPHPPKRGADESRRSVLARRLTSVDLFSLGRALTPTEMALVYLLTCGIDDVPAARLQEGADGIIAAEVDAMKQAKKRHGSGSHRVTRRSR